MFPLQVVINLNDPGVDHTGGEFLLVEQRPRAQSRGTATLIPHGHGLVFTTRDRPVRVAARLVGGAGAARRLGGPLRAAVHPRPGLPRRGMSYVLLGPRARTTAGRPGRSAATGGDRSTGGWTARPRCADRARAIRRRRVFFADEATALASGYRPWRGVFPRAHARWKAENEAHAD